MSQNDPSRSPRPRGWRRVPAGLLAATVAGGSTVHAAVGDSVPIPPPGHSGIRVVAPRDLAAELSGSMLPQCHAELANVRVATSLPASANASGWTSMQSLLGVEIVEPVGKSGKDLRRQPAVVKWVDQWKASRRQAEAEVRARQVELIKRRLQEGFAAVREGLPRDENGREVLPPTIANANATKFLAALPPADIDALARAAADRCPTRREGLVSRARPVLRYAFSDLTPTQREPILALLAESPTPRDPSGETVIYADVPSASPGGPMVVRVRRTRDAPLESFRACGTTYAARAVEGQIRSRTLQLLSSTQTPAAAALGFHPTPDGRWDNTVHLDDASVARRRVERLPPSPTAAELLSAIAERCGLTLVCDTHLSSERLVTEPEQPTVRACLDAAAVRFELLIRQQGGFLLARNQFWPDRDEAEPPHPHVDAWIRLKATKQNLLLEDLAELAQCSQSQLDSLRSYRDRKVDFGADVSLVERAGWSFKLYLTLRTAQRSALFSLTGLRLSELNQAQREHVFSSMVALEAGWDELARSLRPADLLLRFELSTTPNLDGKRSPGPVRIIESRTRRLLWSSM